MRVNTYAANVVIVGGGFSGAMLAVQLLRSAPAGTSIAIVERREQLGEGRAYSTTSESHLLNVPAAAMSALPARDDDFLRWSATELEEGLRPHEFAPRTLYGRYVRNLLLQSARESEVSWRHIRGEAASLHATPEGITVGMSSGEQLLAGCVVLAIGGLAPDNELPADTQQLAGYVSDPWAIDASQLSASSGPVLLLGSGLTAVDTLLTLHGNPGTRSIVMLSRRGLLPRSHEREPGSWFIETSSLPTTTRLLMRTIRDEVKSAARAGVSWYAVMDSLRLASDRIWNTLSIGERRRFLRHVRSYWEIHRHRMAPQVETVVQNMIRSGQLRVMAGRLCAVRSTDAGMEIAVMERGANCQRKMEVSLIVNCTGHSSDILRTKHPLIRQLLHTETIVPDPLRLGIRVSDEGATIDGDGRISPNLYVLGSLRKGTLWETTAVRELKTQALQLAKHLSDVVLREHESRKRDRVFRS